MVETRWLRWLGPGVIAVVALGVVASSAVGAGQRPWQPSLCAEDAVGLSEAARSPETIALDEVGTQPWFRLDAKLDRTGALDGQHLAVGLMGERSSRTLELPAESFAAGPFGRVILVGADDGTTSRLDAYDVTGDCSWPIAIEDAVIRRATIDPGGTTIYEMRVDRATRADLGIWARPLVATAPAVRVLEPIAPDERFGRTFSTELTWELSGSTLAVQSCGEAACRTRVYDPSGGRVRSVAEPDLGQLVGLENNVLVTYAACSGFPCPILATSLRTGSRSVLTDVGSMAALVATPGGPLLVHERVEETGLSLRSVALDGSSASEIGALPDSQRLNTLDGAAPSATRTPPGWVLLSPDGRLPATGPDARTQLRHIPDGETVQLGEIVR